MKYETVKAYLDARTEFELTQAPFPTAVGFQRTIDGVVRDVAGALALAPTTTEKMREYVEEHASFIVRRQAKVAEQRSVPAVRMGPGGPLPAMHYLSIWKDGGSYVPGDVVTYRGTSWHCGLPTTSKPGTNHDWQMMGKSDRERASA